ncbi:hypothetical protein [Oscillibacter sp.]|uniref:hypothetical protein n=1 Tax=Oscillibacter sp. TaxID=1945593 RepID=UPI002896B01A|nr:hypothetical protein [Oscillibacter sp.]
MQKKHILAGLLAAVLALSLAVPVLADPVGDGNIDGGDGGGGMGEGSKQNYWNNEDGCRITVLKNGQKVYQMDWSNKPEAASVKWSFAPKNKLDYLHGSKIVPQREGYKSTVLTVKMPTIVYRDDRHRGRCAGKELSWLFRNPRIPNRNFQCCYSWRWQHRFEALL